MSGSGRSLVLFWVVRFIGCGVAIMAAVNWESRGGVSRQGGSMGGPKIDEGR